MDGFAWIRQPREGRSSTIYNTRYAYPPVEEGWREDVAAVDIEDGETKRLIRAFNELVHKHRVAPAQTVPHDGRRLKMAALQEEALRELGILDINHFMKQTVWPFCKQGGDLGLIGCHYFDKFLPPSVSHEEVEAAVLPERYVWEDNDPKHQQNREVCTHGVTLLDREQLNPAECAPLPLPKLVAREVAPRLQRHLKALDLPCELDFLYANRYLQAKGGYIRFHHDQLTKMGPVVVGVSLGATAHMSYVRTCTPDTKLPGSDGSVEVELAAGSMYVMSGISRYALKHGVLDASSRGDRVSLTFREVTKATDAEGRRRWKRKASEISGPMVKHPAALGCQCCRTSKAASGAGRRPREDDDLETRKQRNGKNAD